LKILGASLDSRAVFANPIPGATHFGFLPYLTHQFQVKSLLMSWWVESGRVVYSWCASRNRWGKHWQFC